MTIYFVIVGGGLILISFVGLAVVWETEYNGWIPILSSVAGLILGIVLLVVAAQMERTERLKADQAERMERLDDRRVSLSSLTAKVAETQTAAWEHDKKYLLNTTQLELRNPGLAEWFVNDQMAKQEIETFEDGLAYQLVMEDSFVRVIMTDGKVVNVICQNMGSKCPTADDLNRQSRTADASSG